MSSSCKTISYYGFFEKKTYYGNLLEDLCKETDNMEVEKDCSKKKTWK